MSEERPEPGDREIEVCAPIADVAAEGDRHSDVIQLLDYSITRLSNYPITQLPNYPITQLRYPIGRLFDPPRRQYLAVRRPELIGALAEKIRTTCERLFEKAPGLQDFAEDDAQHLRVPRIGHRIDAGTPAVGERLGIPRVLFDDLPRRIRASAVDAAPRIGGFERDAAQLGDGRGDPRQLRFFAVEDVLIGVVEIVLDDVAGALLVAQESGQFVAVELLQQRKEIGHAFCFSLQVMQTRVHGIALSRAGAIGSPQSRQIP